MGRHIGNVGGGKLPIGFEFILLSWVDLWGSGIGMMIRFGLIGLGCVMAIFGSPDAESE